MTKMPAQQFLNMCNQLADEARGAIERLVSQKYRNHENVPAQIELSLVYDPQGMGATWRIACDPFLGDGAKAHKILVNATISRDDLRADVSAHLAAMLYAYVDTQAEGPCLPENYAPEAE